MSAKTLPLPASKVTPLTIRLPLVVLARFAEALSNEIEFGSRSRDTVPRLFLERVEDINDLSDLDRVDEPIGTASIVFADLEYTAQRTMKGLAFWDVSPICARYSCEAKFSLHSLSKSPKVGAG